MGAELSVAAYSSGVYLLAIETDDSNDGVWEVGADVGCIAG